jgi:hypothetical protein
MMGADMTLHCAPACDLTPQRIKRIKQVVRAIPEDDEDLRELMALMQYDKSAEAKRRLVKYGLESQYEDREITNLYIPGCPYLVRVAGGLSWGDPPSEAYTVLEHVQRCPQLWQVLEEFAREDVLAAELVNSGTPATGARPRDITVILASGEFGNEHLHYDSVHTALAAVERLVATAVQGADGIERLIGIVVNPGEEYGDPKRVTPSGT